MIEALCGFIITELLIYSFALNNNVVYVVMITMLLTFLLEFFRRNIDIKVKDSRRLIILNSIFSVFLSFCILLQTKIQYNGDIAQKLDMEGTFQRFHAIDILKFFIAYILVWLGIAAVYFIVEKIKQKKVIQDETIKVINKKDKWKYWAIFSGVIAVFYIIFLFICYPGSVFGDSLNSIWQVLGTAELSNHFPIFYTWFVGIFVFIGNCLNNYNIGVALYSLTQILIISGVLGYFILWLKLKGIKTIYLIFTLFYFIGNSVFATYAICMWKDPLFCLFLFLFMLKLYDIIESKGKKLDDPFFVTSIILLNFLVAFLRNNGIFIIILIGIIITICYRKSSKIFLATNIISLIVIILIQGPLYNVLNIKTPSEESLGIPIQQVAYTLSVDGEIKEEDKEFLNHILPIEDWKDSYEIFLVDSIKWNENFDADFLAQNKLDFIKVWLNGLGNNFPQYIKAYLLQTYGFWSIGTKNDYGFVNNGIVDNTLGIHKVDLIERFTGLNLKNWTNNADFLGSGTLIWILFLSGLFLFIQRRGKYTIVLLPCLLLWLSIMIATPVAFSLRYVFVLAYALPLIVLLPIIAKKSEQ